MTMVDALGRVGEIQSRLVELNDLVAGRVSATTTALTSATTSAASATGTTSATSFADALAAATGTGAPATGTAGGQPVASGATGSGAGGAGIVANAEKYLGVPYVFGGEDGSGMDCSGLVQRVYADAGIEVPRLVSGQMTIGTEVASLAEARPGDLIVTGGGDHILIYAGDNQVIHAPYPGRTVCKVDAYMDDSEITTIRRVIPDQVAAASTGPSTVVGAASVTTSAAGVASAAAAPTDLVAAAYASLFSGTPTGTSPTDLTSALAQAGLLS